ncbi:MAG: amidase [Alphaproteobacteria bacterium]|nr:amidase [Alphaproteobacteria bacterium]
MTTDLALMPATDLVLLYSKKDASPVEAAQAALDRIEKFNPIFNAFRVVDAEGALKAARESEARWANGTPAGLIDGVPTTIKDILLTKGLATLRGSKTVDEDQDWSVDAPAVARLREQGAVLLGKTTTPEFGWKGVTDSPLTGITRNPWNKELTPGGSSGGAAAAAVTGMGTLHIGTDGGGSIRIPSALTGLFGMKASFGTVPAWPPSPFGTLANVGPMTRDVGDAALMLSVIAGADARDWYALPTGGHDYRLGLDASMRGTKIAFAAAPGGIEVEPDIAALIAGAVRTFADLGAEIEEAEPPIAGAGDIFTKHWFAGAAHLLKDFTPSQKAEMDPGLIACAGLGEAISQADYIAALDGRQTLGFAMQEFMQDYDLLLTPTLPVAAFPAGQIAPDKKGGEQWVDWTPWTYPFNLTRQPVASIPCGLTGAGLPAALQIVGPMYGEAAVLRAARAFEEAQPWALPPVATG